MRNDNFTVRLQPTLDFSILPIPENDIAISISRADPFSIRRESHLTCITGYSVTSKTFFAVLPEVVRGINEDLIVQRLSSEPFF